jgi:hypothetical protein
MLLKTQTSIKKLTLILTLLIGFAASSTLFAQENMQVLNETSMRDLMDANKYSGKPSYEGINSKYVINTTDKIMSSIDSVQIVKNLLAMPEVISCKFHPSKHSLEVATKKQENYNEISSIKEKLSPFQLYIATYQEIIYTNKK